MIPQTRIARLFDSLKRNGRKGLIAYLTAGDPTPERTPALVEALERGGADLIELGVPFSDPIAVEKEHVHPVLGPRRLCRPC